MAEADDALSDRIWLREALALAIAAFGSEALAKERLREWMADGKLPWSCMSWKALDAEGIARLEQQNRTGGVFFFNTASVVYHEGDPQFWRTGLTIDWKDNGAREIAIAGAKAMGAKVSRAHLLELLPRERDEAPESAKPAERERVEATAPVPPHDPPRSKEDWLERAQKAHPKRRAESKRAWAKRLYAEMLADPAIDAWPSWKTLERSLYPRA